MLRRRVRLLGLAAATGWALLAGSAHADNKTLRIFLGFPAGASSDTVTRLVAEKMRVSLGRNVIVENRPGAGGILANELVKNAAPDGSTLLMTPLAAMVAYPFSHSHLPYDSFKDYEPVAEVASFQLGLGIGHSLPAKTLADYVALVKQNAKYSDFGTPGAGGLPHFFGLMIAQAAGIKLVNVPYKGTASALEALYRGEIPAAVLPMADLGTLVKAGKGRILASSGAKRSTDFPDVPTFKESGYDIEGSAWYALFAPARTPKDVVDKLAQAAIDAVRAPDVKQRLSLFGLEPTGLGPSDFAKVMKADYDRWGPVIKASGFKAD